MKRSFTQINERSHEERNQDVKDIYTKKPCTNKNQGKKPTTINNPVDSDGNTKMMLAAFHGQLELLKNYIEVHLGSVNQQNFHGDTALIFAIKSSSTSIFTKVAIIQYLYDTNANLQLQNLDGNSPLHIAVLYSLPIVANLLIQNGALLEVPNNDGLTPLMLALKQNDMDNARLLISWGADMTSIKSCDDNNNNNNNNDQYNALLQEQRQRIPSVVVLGAASSSAAATTATATATVVGPTTTNPARCRRYVKRERKQEERCEYSRKWLF